MNAGSKKARARSAAAHGAGAAKGLSMRIPDPACPPPHPPHPPTHPCAHTIDLAPLAHSCNIPLLILSLHPPDPTPPHFSLFQVTVPFVLSIGVGFSQAAQTAEGFGMLTIMSAAPIIAVLGLALTKDKYRAMKEGAGRA